MKIQKYEVFNGLRIDFVIAVHTLELYQSMISPIVVVSGPTGVNAWELNQQTTIAASRQPAVDQGRRWARRMKPMFSVIHHYARAPVTKTPACCCHAASSPTITHCTHTCNTLEWLLRRLFDIHPHLTKVCIGRDSRIISLSSIYLSVLAELQW